MSDFVVVEHESKPTAINLNRIEWVEFGAVATVVNFGPESRLLLEGEAVAVIRQAIESRRHVHMLPQH